MNERVKTLLILLGLGAAAWVVLRGGGGGGGGPVTVGDISSSVDVDQGVSEDLLKDFFGELSRLAGGGDFGGTGKFIRFTSNVASQPPTDINLDFIRQLFGVPASQWQPVIIQKP